MADQADRLRELAGDGDRDGWEAVRSPLVAEEAARRLLADRRQVVSVAVNQPTEWTRLGPTPMTASLVARLADGRTIVGEGATCGEAYRDVLDQLRGDHFDGKEGSRG